MKPWQITNESIRINGTEENIRIKKSDDKISIECPASGPPMISLSLSISELRMLGELFVELST